MPQWLCPECETENEPADQLCAACDAERPAGAESNVEKDDDDDDDDGLKNVVVGAIISCEPIEGKSKLLKLEVDVGHSTLPIVTNAPNVREGARVVVACVGAVVGGVQVKKATVGGVVSEGMLCDAPALGWVGGGAGTAALVPPSFAPGSKPPASRPRMDGK